jgi:hypothetical protein
MATSNACKECKRGPLAWVGCAHVVCPKRKSYTAVIATDGQMRRDTVIDAVLPDAYLKQPTNKD